ncbi:MAG TPA: trigger factor [Firmicutes bacterium]|nr:trigger factor [Bacillota bacterium]
MMKHEVTKLQNSQTEISMVFEENEWKQATKKAFDKIVANLEVPGFRKGHVPEAIAKARIDNTKMYNTAIDSLLSDAYRNVVAEEKIVPWARPNVEVTKMSETELEIKISVLTAPEVKLGQYKGHHVDKKIPTVSKEQIDDEIKRIQAQNAEIILKDGPAAIGDTVVIDFEGFVDGKPFEGGKAENHSLELGSGQFIPGFEEQLVGLKAGAAKEINVTFPASYAKELAGKEAMFKIIVHEVKEKKVPEVGQALFDELKISEVTSKESFEEHVKTNLMKQEEENVQKEYYEALLAKITDLAEIDLNHDIIHDEVDAMHERLEQDVKQNGMTFEQYLEMSGQTEETLHHKLHEEAERNIRASLVLEKIAEIEEITISPELVDFEIAKIADQYKMEFDKVKEILTKDMNRFIADIKTRHIRDFLLQNND